MNLEPQSANTRRGIYLLPNLLTTDVSSSVSTPSLRPSTAISSAPE
jgi:hypothetical protein